LAVSSGTFAASANFFYGSNAFLVALGTVVEFGELGIHFFFFEEEICNTAKSSKKTKNCIAESEHGATHKK